MASFFFLSERNALCLCVWIGVVSRYGERQKLKRLNRAIRLRDIEVGINLRYLGLGDGFLDMTPKIQVANEKTGKVTI